MAKFGDDYDDEDDPSQRILVADGFETALLGFGQHFTQSLAIYDYERCVSTLMDRDGMGREEAEEFLEFNTLGAWVGKGTPVFLTKRNPAVWRSVARRYAPKRKARR